MPSKGLQCENDLPNEINRILAERKTLMPAKMTLAGENTYKLRIRGCLKPHTSLYIETYQTDTPSDGGRIRADDIDSWAQPRCQSLIANIRFKITFAKFSRFNLKDSNNSRSGVARSQL